MMATHNKMSRPSSFTRFADGGSATGETAPEGSTDVAWASGLVRGAAGADGLPGVEG